MTKKDQSKTKAELVRELEELRHRADELGRELAGMPARTAAAAPAPEFSRGGVTILVVDDSSVVRKAISLELSRAGYKVVTAGNGREALGLIDATIAAVLLDLHLPGINGIQVLEKIRQDRPELPVIMLTAAAELDARIAAFAAGADDYLIKPYHRLELLTRLDRLVRLHLSRFALLAEIENRERAQASLDESETKLRFLLENAGSMIAVTDRNGVYEYVSPSHRQWGYQPQELLGKSGLELVHPEDRPALALSLLQGQKDSDLSSRIVRYRVVDKWGATHFIHGRFSAIRDDQGNLEKILLIVDDMTLEQWLEGSLRESRAILQAAMDQSQAGIAIIDAPGATLRYINEAGLTIIGESEETLPTGSDIMKYIAEHRLLRSDGSPVPVDGNLLTAVQSGEAGSREFIIRPGERGERAIMINATPIFGAGGTVSCAIAVFFDITESKRAERERELTVSLLQVLNRPGSVRDLIHEVTRLLHHWCECEAVGIRLRDGDDFPYCETQGFPQQFVQLESRLCARDLNGQVLRDPAGHPILECMCGNILCGRFDPTQPFFTPGGSFWSNCTSELLASTTEADRQARTRNRCNAEGYESVALVPLRAGKQTFGLLQLNDHRPGRFTPAAITLLEQLAHSVAIAIRQRQAEEALRESEERWQFALEGAGDGVWDWDVSTNRVYFSRQFKVMLGYTDAEPWEHIDEWENRLHPDDLERAMGDIDRYFSSAAGSYSTEYRLRCRDGSYKWILGRGRVVSRSPEGKILRVIGTHTDISGRRRMEEELRESRQTFATLIENLPGFIYRCNNDRDWTMNYISGGCLAITGYAPEDFIGNRTVAFNDIVRSDFQEPLWEKWQQLLDRREVFEEEYPIITRDGGTRWVWERGRGQFAPDGTLLYLEGFITDVTYKKLAQRALKASEEQFREMFDNHASVKLLIDPETGIIQFANHAAAEYYGYALEEFRGMHISRINMHPPAEVVEEMERARKVEKSHFYFRHRLASGEVRDVEVYSSPVQAENRTLLYSIVHDITDRRRAEVALREAHSRMTATMDALPDVMFEIDQDGRLLDYRAPRPDMLYVSPDRFFGKSFHEVLPKEAAAVAQAAIDEAARTGRHSGGVYCLDLPDGTRWFELSMARKKTAEGPPRFITLARDITDRKRTEAFNQIQRDLGIALSATTDLLDALRICLDAAIQSSGMDCGGIYLHDSDSGGLDLVFSQGLSPEFTSLTTHLAHDHPNTMLVMAGHPVYTGYTRLGLVLNGTRTAEGLRALAVIPIRNEGQIIGCLNIASHSLDDIPVRSRDILEIIVSQIGGVIARARTQQALKISEMKYRELVENANSIILRMDPEGRVIYINEFAQSFFGYTPNEIVGKKVIGTIVPELESSGRDLAGMMENIFAHPDRYKFNENENMRKNGERVWVSWTNKALVDEQGKLTEILAIGNDTTERKRAEEHLRESETRFRELVSAAPINVVVVQEGQAVFANPEALKTLGYTEAEFLGVRMQDLVPPREQPVVKERVRQTMGGTANQIREISVLRKSGEELVMESVSVLIQYNHRPATLVVGRDISLRKQIEEERLKTERLESIGVLAGGIAHDFNNILMGITGNIALAKMELNAGEDPRESMLDAEKAADRARDLTRQLLTFSRGGKPVIGLEQVNDIVTEAVGFVRHGANVRCDLMLAPDLLPARVDAGQISQVIHNLVINAIQAMPAGGNVIIASENTRLDADNPLALPAGPYIMVSVADRGHGIASDILLRIFDPYFTTKECGSGLGLASAYSIITRHQGKIAVESEVGRGTIFRLYLPAEETRLKEPGRRKTQHRTFCGRVLVMDDEPEVRRVARRMLERMGCEVEEAENGEAAVEQYRQAMQTARAFSVVIFDLTIPGGMGGREAVRVIRELDPEVRAIVASGYSEDPVMANHEEFGFSGMVAKPYKIEELSQVLDAVLAAKPVITGNS